jgi:long-chain acyl-CoA synthetase
VRRDVRYRDQLATTPREGIATLYDVMKDASERYGNRPCMATREFIGWKTPKIKEFGPNITWQTFLQVYQQALQFGAALKAAGCVAAPETTNLDKITQPCRIAVFENTCAPWMIAAMGAFTQSITVTTVYATLGIDAVMEAVSDNVIRVIVCNKASVAKLVKNCANMPTLKYIIYTNDLVPVDAKIEWPQPPNGVQVMPFDEFVKSGDVKKYPPVPPKPSTCAVVMYTVRICRIQNMQRRAIIDSPFRFLQSGSTGKPKGVIITHSQVVAGCASADVGFGIREGEEVYLAYLPLAHIMELMAECVMISKGCALCYADPKSLTTTGAYPIGALEVYSPTIMVAVPKIWDVIKKGIQAKVAAESPVKQELVAFGLKWRQICLKHGFDAPLFDKVVFKKFKKAVGGRLRLAVSGGGPLNGEVQDFIRTAFGISLVQGYVSRRMERRMGHAEPLHCMH